MAGYGLGYWPDEIAAFEAEIDKLEIPDVNIRETMTEYPLNDEITSQIQKAKQLWE
jgi:hypothetical protein